MKIVNKLLILLVLGCYSFSLSAVPVNDGTLLVSDNPQIMTDKSITYTILYQMKNDNVFSGAKIKIKTTDGVVTINGTVLSQYQAGKIVELAESLGGVNDVDAAGLVSLADKQPLTDTIITAKIKGLLIREKLINKINLSISNLNVKTINGTVYLSGKTETADQLDHIINLAKSVPEVKRVTTQVAIG